MAVFENKFGTSPIDATKKNALPPYLDLLFQEYGVGGSDVEVLEFALLVDYWVEEINSFSYYAKKSSNVIDGSSVILLSARGDNYPISGANIVLDSVDILKNGDPTFTFKAIERPIETITAIVLVITSKNTVAARFNTTLDQMNKVYASCVSAQSAAQHYSSVATSAATLAEDYASAADASASAAASDAAYCDEVVTDAASVLQGQLHPVGSTYITSTNTNPSSILGIGTWELYDKEFASYSSTTSVLSIYTTYVSSVSGFLLVRKGHDITIRFQLTTNAALGYADRNLVNFTTSSIGLTSAYADWNVIGSSSNNSNNIDGIILGQLNGDNDNTTFILSSRSTVTRVSEQQIPSGSIVSFLLKPLFTFDQMMDSACNKFYWRRTQ